MPNTEKNKVRVLNPEDNSVRVWRFKIDIGKDFWRFLRQKKKKLTWAQKLRRLREEDPATRPIGSAFFA